MTRSKMQRLTVVDDEPDRASGLRRMLKLRGFEVHIAHCGEEAVEQAKMWQHTGRLDGHQDASNRWLSYFAEPI